MATASGTAFHLSFLLFPLSTIKFQDYNILQRKIKKMFAPLIAILVNLDNARSQDGQTKNYEATLKTS